MRPHAIPSALFALMALARGSPAEEARDPGAVRKEGAHFALTCHGGGEALAENALSVVEAVWPIVATAFGVPDAKPERPLDVHLYRTVEGYRAADEKLTNGKFRRNLAMSHWDSRSAHVAVQPPCRDETLRALGLPPLTVAMLAWEATHVARYELCPSFREHPDWFCDGFAAWVTAQVVEARLPAGLEATPFWAADMVAAQRLQTERKLPPAKSLLADAVADLDLYDRYAARVVFYSFLASEPNRGRLGEVMSTIRRTGGGDGYATAVRDGATAAFGGEDKAFAKFVQDLRPQWDEVYRSLWTAGAEWPQIAFPDKNAVAWRREPLESAAFAAKGTLRILPADAQQLNFLFARTGDGFYSVAFVADRGFTLFEYRSRTEEWIRVGNADTAGLRLGISTDFAVEGRGTRVTVKVDGRSWEFDLPRELPKGIVWGLGAQAGPEGAATGSAGLWKRVSVLPLAP
jgi:hypothetical protein